MMHHEKLLRYNYRLISMSLETISVSDYMSKNVKTIESNEPLYTVCKIMKESNIGSIIAINENGDPVGMVTERDIVCNMDSENSNIRTEVHNIMSKPIITLYEMNSLKDALQAMQTNNFRRLPVVNRERKLVGIITDKDIFKVILTNEELLSNISNDKNFQLPASILENYRAEIFKDIS